MSIVTIVTIVISQGFSGLVRAAVRDGSGEGPATETARNCLKGRDNDDCVRS
jgi:hypothetical protein